MHQQGPRLFQVCDRRRGPVPGGEDVRRANIREATEHIVWINVLAFDHAQAIRIAGDFIALHQPMAVAWPPKSLINGVSVEEIIALHIDQAPCIAAFDEEPEQPEGTAVTLIVPARQLGIVLEALEHDADVSVIGWVQSAPGVSAECEIALIVPFLPALWNHADVSLRWEFDDRGGTMHWRIEPHCIRGRVKRAAREYTRRVLYGDAAKEYLK